MVWTTRLSVYAKMFHFWNNNRHKINHHHFHSKHKSKSWISRFSICHLTFVLAIVSPITQAAVGSVAGEASVLPSGASSYTVPLQVAPGIAGMTPGISLQYNSQSGNSLLGVGWSIGGLSTIHRCPQTIEQDGLYKGIQMNAEDRLCLDGKRLMPLSGSYSSSSAEYRTEIEEYSKIVQIGSCNANCKFRVYKKSGEQYFYGYPTHAQQNITGHTAPLQWALNEIKDSVNNFIRFIYDEDLTNNTHRIKKIVYGGNGNLIAGSMNFNYIQREDPMQQYMYGALINKTKVLDTIDVKAANYSIIRQYRLDYAQSPANSRTLLASLEECDGGSSTSDCLALTEFTWYGGNTAYGSWVKSTSAFIRGKNRLYKCRRIVQGDVNGDGRSDLVCAYDTDDHGFRQGDIITYVSLATNDGFAEWVDWETQDQSAIFDPTYCNMFRAADFNGDGLSDLVCNSNDGKFFVQLSLGDEFDRWREWAATTPSCMKREISDVNADGRSDLLCIGNSSTSVGLSTGSSFENWETWISNAGGPSQTDKCRQKLIGDANGDGLADGICLYDTTTSDPGKAITFVQIAKSDGFLPWEAWHITTSSFELEHCNRFSSADFNADGLIDFMCVKGTTFYVQLSTGDSYTSWQNWGTDAAINQSSCKLFTAADMDGDGKADIVCSQSNNGSGFTYVKQSGLNANNELSFNSWSVKTGDTHGTSSCLFQSIGDMQANNMPDLVCLSSDGYSYSLNFKYGAPGGKRFSAASYTPPGPGHSLVYLSGDMLETIDNKIASPTKFVYSTLADDDIYTSGIGTTTSNNETCAGTGSDYPIICRVGNKYVVRQVETDDGVGGTRITGYEYKYGRSHLKGRGFLGFGEVVTTDVRGQKESTARFDQTFATEKGANSSKFATNGLPRFSQTKDLTTGKTISDGSSTYTIKTPGTKRYEVLSDTTIEKSYEKNNINSLIKKVTSTNANFDSYGNPKKVTVSTSGGYSTITNSLYDNDISKWYLGRLTSSTVTKTTPTHSDSRTSAFNYYSSNGLLKTEIVEPNTALELRTAYEYGPYGNKSLVTVSDTSQTPGWLRIPTAISTTTFDYSQLAANNTYTITSLNALDHKEIKTIDARYGVAKNLKGPNNLTTTWVYDGFGRKEKEIRADATQTQWIRNWCDSSSTCPDSQAQFQITKKEGKANNANQASPTVTQYFDTLTREIRTKTTGFTGQAIQKLTKYDNRGRLDKESRPFYNSESPVWTIYDYDDFDRVKSIQTPDGKRVLTTYIALKTKIVKKDNNGDYNQTVTQQTNALGEEIKITDEKGIEFTKHYDAFGNLERVSTPGGGDTVMTYDLRGNKITMNEPNMGIWQYKYDALGQLRWQKDAKGQTSSMKYDELGRMTHRTEAEGTTTWKYDWRSMGEGKLAQIIAPNNYRKDVIYDDKGRERETRTTAAGKRLDVIVTFDEFSRVKQTIYPGNYKVQNIYNSHGYLNKVKDITNNKVLWEATALAADGQIRDTKLGNNIYTVKSYHPYSGRIDSIKTGRNQTGSSEIQFLKYTFDSLGNLKTRQDLNALYNLKEVFFYDQRNRLIQSNINSTQGNGSVLYAYDDLGNITKKGNVSNYVYGNATNAGPHAVTAANGQSYSYDKNGNMTGGAGRSLTWTSYNKPSRISKGSTQVDFKYGPDRARYEQIKKVGGVTTKTLYLGKAYEEISKGGNTTKKYYISAGGQTFAVHTITGSNHLTKYLHRDHLGSVDVISNQSGWGLSKFSFAPFGERRGVDNWNNISTNSIQLASLDTTRGFTDHEQLDDVGLVHMNGRVYDPALGRFLSADPQVQYTSNLQNYNRYTYVNNNPLSFTDPSGFGFFSNIKKAFKKILSNPWVRLAIGIAVAAWVGPVAYAHIGFATGSGTLAAVAGGFAGGFALGGITTGSLKGALIGGLQGAAFGYVGHGTGFIEKARKFAGGLGKVGLHGAVGGTFSRASGGSFKDGFVSAATTSFVNASVKTRGFVASTVRSAVAGGAAAAAIGGKFINGAKTAAFSYMFNDAAGRNNTSRRFRNKIPEDRISSTLRGVETIAGALSIIAAPATGGVSLLVGGGLLVYNGIIGESVAQTIAGNISLTSGMGNPSTVKEAIGFVDVSRGGFSVLKSGIESAATMNQIIRGGEAINATGSAIGVGQDLYEYNN